MIFEITGFDDCLVYATDFKTACATVIKRTAFTMGCRGREAPCEEKQFLKIGG